MKTRLTAYRRELSTDATYDIREYNLDLSADPSVTINFNWLDLKEPDTRKTDFSQTIKLPFTDNNNQFFQSWFDVNLSTLVFNVTDKYSAVLYVDSIPQLTGFIQLKAIYLNSEHYEVVVFGSTANLFSDIKGRRLQDAFLTPSTTDSTVMLDDTSMDHQFLYANVINSWKGELPVIGGGTTDDIMYPIIDYGHGVKPMSDGMFWSMNDPNAFSQFFENDEFAENVSWANIIENANLINISKLKPAIRIRKLLLMILQRAGYICQSTFLGINADGTFDEDNEWFGKIYMTLATQFKKVQGSPMFGFRVTTGTQTFTSGETELDNTMLEWSTELYDMAEWFWLDNNLLVIPDYSEVPGIVGNGMGIEPTGIQFQIDLAFTVPANMNNGNPLNEFTITYGLLQYYDGNYYTTANESVTYNTGGAGGTIDVQYTPGIVAMPGGMIWMTVQFECESQTDFVMSSGSWELINNGYGGFANAGYGSTINIRRNIPDITQADFVKDLLNRFNLIIQVDNDDDKKLLIEPYHDYIATGKTKYWTDKLDSSKEIKISPTTDIQKNILNFTDQESDDFINSKYKEEFGKVYGTMTKYNLNDFASQEWSNSSVFAPFVVQGLPSGGIWLSGMLSSVNLAIHYAAKQGDDGGWEQADDKPKLFWYSGTPVTFSGTDGFGNPFDWAFVSGDYSFNGDWGSYKIEWALGYQGFPLCLPYNIDSGDTSNPLDSGGITASTKQLLWTHYSPGFYTSFVGDGVVGTLNMWGGNVFGNIVSEHGLFQDYWAQYINEIYSEDARLMDCHLYLEPSDIANFQFADKVYIKNTVWRVLNIYNYSLVENKSTLVRLLKVVEKNPYECEAVPYSYNDDGTISFKDPENLSGGLVSVTEECCTGQNPDWTFIQTNASTGVGDCYYDLNTNLAPAKINNPALVPVPPKNTMDNKSIILSDMSSRLQNITLFMECVTNGTTEGIFGYAGWQTKVYRFPLDSLSQIQVDITGDIVGGTDGYFGETTYVQYYALMKNTSGTISHLGSGGAIKERDITDANFPEPTITITNSQNALQLKVSVPSGDKKINWVAKVNIVVRQIRGKVLPKLQYKALYQNLDPIQFNDGVWYLQWN
jgi:hypothetical protein